ncbi:MAG: uncharacterized membrane-anchored protein YjiN (DUF445 family) [Chlamydiales bacterium]|jgi:uncharacterized membrane-anchored protein YjiN (DUF445 family)
MSTETLSLPDSDSSWEKQAEKVYFSLNKSSATNLVALGVMGLGYVSPVYPEILKSVGLFALSGAITNWLAIHMLFEKVPGLYGSGVIPSRFEEFKEGIRSLIMLQFFSPENMEKFFQSSQGNGKAKVDFHKLVESLDYEFIFENLLAAIQESTLGGMLAMFGGNKALLPVKLPFITKMKGALVELSERPSFQEEVKKSISGTLDLPSLKSTVDEIVQKRLDELTPQMVKEIIQKMIRSHLGWLVVWGGVFGGLIGLVAHFL